MFLEVQEKHDIVAHFSDDAWKKRVAYLAGNLDQVNELNLKLQAREQRIHHPISRPSTDICRQPAKLVVERKSSHVCKTLQWGRRG